MNRILFEQVKKAVLAEPKLVNMKFYCGTAKNLCDTTGCIGGWAMFLSGMKKFVVAAYKDKDHKVPFLCADRVAAALLDLSHKESQELFYFYAKLHDKNSPYYELANELQKHRVGTLVYAKVVVKAIDLCMTRCKEGTAYHD